MRTVTRRQRRQLLCRRHHLAGDAEGPEEATRSVLALHATDPATVYLSVLARSSSTSLLDVAAAMYERRTLVRWLGMRRTLFLVPYPDVPVVQAAASCGVAATLRTRLVNQLERNGTRPPLDDDIPAWVDSLAENVELALRRRGSATGSELSDDEPRLRTTILARAPSDRPQNVTSSLLTMLSAQGRIVRSTPTGAWTCRQHSWQHAERWWPEGLPVLDTWLAQRELARRWLSRFGPATVDDLQWWCGWNKSTVHRALAELPIEDVDLHGAPGIRLRIDESAPDDLEPSPPTAALLPALDATAMGWKHREWYLAVDPAAIFDRAGNIGPSVWWDGEIIGSWAITAAGEIRTACPVDRGAQAADAIAALAATLQHRLDGAVITPSVRTPLERALADHG
ncbi:MAG: hypothetical protein QOF53_1576 [Nocardioidaceae bacterium]|jgi:hypothetical protein|nr:hypothetical protein [Nocardioidaceae bacterium]